MLFAIVMGTFGGALLAFIGSSWLLGKIADRFASRVEQKKTIKVAGLVFGAIALAPAIFLSVMAGGNLGTRVAGLIARAVGLGDAASAVLLALEVVAATAVTVMVNAAVGAAMGVMLARILYPPRP